MGFKRCEWVISSPHPERERLARDAGIHRLTAQILLNRGITDGQKAREFLTPEFRTLRPPSELPNAVAAARRLLAAARAGERIVVYGDYDVDGITGAAILWRVLALAGAHVDYYLPSRLEEGYGLNSEALERIKAAGGELVVTVDCGVTALEPARRARELGLSLIITDHHCPQDSLPDCELLVHPTACGTPGSNPHLCGAAVALKVAWALAQEISGGQRAGPEMRDFLLDATALAALGLVADVAPLIGENRVIASFGLKHLCHSSNHGLRALIEVAGLANKAALDDYDVGFLLAPRLNALGRLGHAAEAVELFTRADAQQAAEIARKLDGHNRQRQTIERGIVQQAEQMTRERGFDRDGYRAIVLANRDWHPGVIGIVASRLVGRFHRPAVLIALGGDDDVSQGSARSIPHFPLNQALAACAEHLVGYGGHAMAAGVRIRPRQIEGFTAAFLAQAADRLTPADMQPRLLLDDEVHLGELTAGTVGPLSRLAPFGQQNARPLLATQDVEIVDVPRAVGSSASHLRFVVRQDNEYRKAIAFHCGRDAAELAEHRRLRLAFEPLINQWNGHRSIDLKVVDWKACG